MEIPVRMINTNTASFCGNNKTTLVEEREIKPVMMIDNSTMNSTICRPMTQECEVKVYSNDVERHLTSQLKQQCFLNSNIDQTVYNYGQTSFSGRPLVEECDVKVIQNKWNPISQLERSLFNQEQTLKHWFTTVQFDECLLRKCCTENFNCIVSKVDPILRVVVIKCLKQKLSTSLVTPIKRIICLPKHVDFRGVKVTICKERKVIIVKAPTLYTPEQLECEREFCTEYEPTIYKVLKHLRRQCPQFMVPRCIRNQQTGQHTIHLDVHCSGFLPEEMQITMKNVGQVLRFKANRRQFIGQQQQMWQNVMGFGPQTLRHELIVPSWIHVDKLSWCKLNSNTLRVMLPIVQLPSWEQMKLWRMNKRFLRQC